MRDKNIFKKRDKLIVIIGDIYKFIEKILIKVKKVKKLRFIFKNI